MKREYCDRCGCAIVPGASALKNVGAARVVLYNRTHEIELARWEDLCATCSGKIESTGFELPEFEEDGHAD